MKKFSAIPIFAAFAMVAIAILAGTADGQLLRRPLFGGPAYQEQYVHQQVIQQQTCNGLTASLLASL